MNTVPKITLLAMTTIVLIVLYFAFRVVASSCTGTVCDAYIPLSLLIPLAIWVMAAITGITGTIQARLRPRWFAVLGASTVLGVFGPLVALWSLRDRPDVFVPAATALEVLVAIAALAYAVLGRRSVRS